eukprot:Skav214459  [mRNA]  locus=scaffold1870:169113:182014:+ [translate_table: standard]
MLERRLQSGSDPLLPQAEDQRSMSHLLYHAAIFAQFRARFRVLLPAVRPSQNCARAQFENWEMAPLPPLDDNLLARILPFVTEANAAMSCQNWKGYLYEALKLDMRTLARRCHCIRFMRRIGQEGSYRLAWTRTYDAWSSQGEQHIGKWSIDLDHILCETLEPETASETEMRYAPAGYQMAQGGYFEAADGSKAADWELPARTGKQCQAGYQVDVLLEVKGRDIWDFDALLNSEMLCRVGDVNGLPSTEGFIATGERIRLDQYFLDGPSILPAAQSLLEADAAVCCCGHCCAFARLSLVFRWQHEDGWVATEELTQEPWEVQYAHSVQWALSRLPAASMSTNMALQTGQERCLAIAATFGALCCGSVSVSVVTNFLARLERSRQCKKQALEAANRYIQDNNLAGAYMKRVKLEVEQEDLRQTKMTHMKQLHQLPEDIRQELFREARGRTLRAFNFFQHIQEDSAAEASLCSVAVDEVFHLPEDVVFRANVTSKGLFLVSGCAYSVAGGAGRSSTERSGKALGERPGWRQILLQKFSKRVAPRQVSDGLNGLRVPVSIDEAMSEQALWVMAWQHQGTLWATSNGAGVLLQTNEFYKILAEHPNILHHAVLHARDYVDHMNQLLRSGACCTDLPLPTE